MTPVQHLWASKLKVHLPEHTFGLVHISSWWCCVNQNRTTCCIILKIHWSYQHTAENNTTSTITCWSECGSEQSKKKKCLDTTCTVVKLELKFCWSKLLPPWPPSSHATCSSWLEAESSLIASLSPSPKFPSPQLVYSTSPSRATRTVEFIVLFNYLRLFNRKIRT